MSLIVLYGAVCFFIGTILFKKAAGNLGLKYANVINLVYYYLLFSFLIPALSNATGLYSDWMAQQARFSDSAILAFYATFASFVALPTVILFLEKLFNICPNLEQRRIFELPKQDVEKGSELKVLVWLAMGGVVLSFLYVVIATLVDLPIETLIKGGNWLEMAVARRQWVMTEVGWIQYTKNILSRWIVSLASLFAFGYLLKTKKQLRLMFFLLWIWLAMIAFLYLFSSLERAPLVHLLIAHFYVWTIFRGGISLKRLVVMIIMIITVGVFLFYITLRLDSPFQAATRFLERILFVQYSGTILTFDFFPRITPFLGFQGICHGGLGRLLGCTGIRYSLLLMQAYNPIGWTSERAGYVSTFYIAEGYACFGMAGIAFSIFLAGIWLTVLQWLFWRVRPHPISIGFLSLLLVRIMSFLGDGILALVYPSELIIPTILVVSFVFWIRGRPVVIVLRPYRDYKLNKSTVFLRNNKCV